MIAVDTNILIHAHRKASPSFEEAFSAIRRLAESSAPWAIPWPCLHEFLGIATHPRVFAPASTLDEAIQQVEIWMQSLSLRVIGESPDHWEELCAIARAGKIAGPKVHDARIAAICIGHGVREFWTADRDFSRFPSLKAVNPLVRR
jgi:toxin-antitoxin system PIN domain toxin